MHEWISENSSNTAIKKNCILQVLHAGMWLVDCVDKQLHSPGTARLYVVGRLRGLMRMSQMVTSKVEEKQI